MERIIYFVDVTPIANPSYWHHIITSPNEDSLIAGPVAGLCSLTAPSAHAPRSRPA